MKLNSAFSLRYLMKLNPISGLLPILTIGMIMSLPAVGQEDKPPMDYEATFREVRNDSVTTDSELKTLSKPINSVVVRETETPTPAKSSGKTPSKPSDKSQKSEDPLSFNFLYYIIEKFKMSDMIE
jgi:hypothetical protein